MSLPQTLWAVMNDVATTTGKTRISVLRTVLGKTNIGGDELASSLGIVQAVPILAKPFLYHRVRVVVHSLNQRLGVDISDKQARRLADWVLANAGLMQKVFRAKGQPDPADFDAAGNMTEAQWASFWKILTPAQALRVAGF